MGTRGGLRTQHSSHSSPQPALLLLPPCASSPLRLQSCAKNPSSRSRTAVTPVPQSPGTRPPNKEPPHPSLSVNTIKGPALPSESVSLTGKPGTRSGMLSCFLAAKQVPSMGVFRLLQEEPGKMTPRSGPGTTQQRPRLSSLQPGNRPVSCLGSQSLPSPGTNPGGFWEADILSFWPHIPMCFRSPTPADSINSWGSRMEGSPGGECLACA